jgi:hypothetical protein
MQGLNTKAGGAVIMRNIYGMLPGILISFLFIDDGYGRQKLKEQMKSP